MDKFLYLAKSLSRTKRKDYENYVINAIYFRVGNKDLFPVSQQAVRGSDGKFYYIDLYFPQLKLGIECDERHHAYQKEEDALRELEIARKLSVVDVFDVININEFQMVRIDVSKEYFEVEAQINECVELIRKKISENGLIDLFNINNPEKFYSQKNVIKVEDNIIFNSNKEVYNNIFGENYEASLQNGGRRYKKLHTKHGLINTYPYFPQLTTDDKPTSKGYVNKISTDGQEICEYNIDPNINAQRRSENRHVDISEKRVTFTKLEDPITGKMVYRFVGIFEADRYDTNDALIFKKINSEFQIIR